MKRRLTILVALVLTVGTGCLDDPAPKSNPSVEIEPGPGMDPGPGAMLNPDADPQPDGEPGMDIGDPIVQPEPDPEPNPEPDDGSKDMCGDVRQSEKVFYGTDEPTYLPMTPGQIMAVADFGGCSGLLIAPEWVLSAQHCGVRRGAQICFGPEPSNANICFRAQEVYTPNADMALIRLSESVTARAPEIVPVPVLTEDLDNTWIGRTAEASGYGTMENGRTGTRKFTAQPIVAVRGNTLTIDGEGERGVCFGDSGGPVMVIASDGTVRTAGVLSNGDGSCVGRDNYTRVDVFLEWIEGYTGPTVVDGAGCGNITAEGRCMDGRAVYCDDDQLRSEVCEGGCGWFDRAEGFRCITGPDPCQGVDSFGSCDGEVARWCENGVYKERDCGGCGERCNPTATVRGAYCEPDPCMGLDYLGRCNGDVAEYCSEAGEFRTRDCTREGLSCGYINEQYGYWCR